MTKGLLAFLLFFLFPVCSAAAGKPLYQYNVLIIHSYHKQMAWVEEVHGGITNRLVSSLGNTVDLKVEYLDSKRYDTREYFAAVAAVWRLKYAEQPPDCIIVCDDNAFDLVLSLRDELFAGIPIVFCGVNYYDEERFSTLDNVTGVIEGYDLVGTLNIIKNLMPERTSLFVINDDTLTGRANRARVEDVSSDFLTHFKFVYSGAQSIETLRSTVGELSEETAILLMSFNRDAQGSILRYRDAIAAIRSATASPIFGVWSFYLGKGIVGGSLVNGATQGERAAELCLRILAGASTSELPIIRTSRNQPMFDYHELQRFAIPLDRLPEASTVINMPDSIWHRHKRAITTVVALMLAQLLIIALLVHSIRTRKRSEQRLARSEQNLATTLTALGEGVISMDTGCNIVRANPAAAELLKTPLEHLTGRNLPALLEELDSAAGKNLSEMIQGCCATGETATVPENTLMRIGAETGRRFSGSCSAIRDARGNITGTVFICRDITEQESMRNMLAQSQKMEAIGQLAGGVAHDFNNLLTCISGFAELLNIQLDAGPQRQNVQKVIEATNRAKALTRQLLSFARKGSIVSIPVDCHAAIRATADLLERSIDKQIEIITRLHAANAIIMGDPVQLDNILLNLGINGADAIDGKGTLTYTTSNETVSEPQPAEFGESIPPGSYIRICVSDTGCGMDEELRHRIFEPFFTTKPVGKGTGLGLSAVFGAIKEHNGRLRLLSETGKGTEFILFFPVAVKGTTIKPTRNIPLRGHGETILVIDDEKLVLSSTRALLEELGYRVLQAEGGRSGVLQFKENSSSIDLILLDMIMPDMDGAACFAALRSIRSDVRVIVSSGYARTVKTLEMERQGAAGFLRKPYSAYEASLILRQVLDTPEPAR